MTKITSLLSLASLLAAAGCTASTPDGSTSGALTNEDYDDMAAAVGSMVAGSGSLSGEASAMADSMAAAEGSLEADTTTEGPLGNSIEVVLHGDFRFEYQTTCFGLDGAELDACDGSADGAEIALDWSGSFDGPRYDVQVSRDGEWTIVGLQGETAELNGEAHFDLQSRFEGLFREARRDLDLSYDAEYDAVLLDTETHQAVGGTIRYSLEGVSKVDGPEVDREVDIDVQANVTFQADGTAELMLDGERFYTIILASGEIIAEGGASLDIGADQ